MDDGGRRSDASCTGRTDGTASLRQHIRDLLRRDHRDRAVSIAEIVKQGGAAAPLLVDTLLRHPTDAWVHEDLTTALEEIGKPAADALLEALEGLKDFRRCESVYLLETIAQTLGRLNDRRAAQPLWGCIQALNAEIRKSDTPAERAELMRASRSGLHGVLGQLGAREGLDDLLKILGDGRRRVHEEIIETLGRIGDRRFLAPLLRVYALEIGVSEWSARHVKWAFREIARRERVDREDRIFRGLTDVEEDLLDKLLPRPRAAGAVLHLNPRAHEAAHGGRKLAGSR